nr:MAG TPA: hypothetical protein [Caudoviricetes sp.]
MVFSSAPLNTTLFFLHHLLPLITLFTSNNR